MDHGETADQILADLEVKYGDRLRMMPDRGGRENLAWQLPWVFAALILFSIFFRTFRRFRRRPDSNPYETKTIDSNLQEKILRDLNERT
jgi:cytochrome c-type biogenesis protein CcmH/NrfF